MASWLTRFREKRRIKSLLAYAPGPAPWYWKSFPPIQCAERSLVWRLNPDARDRSDYLRLVPSANDRQILLSVSMYTRVFPLPPGLIGLWFGEGNLIRIFAVDPSGLVEFKPGQLLQEGIQNYGGFSCGGGVLGEYSTSTDLEEGEHRIEMPSTFMGLNSLLLIGDYARIQEPACCAVFEILPGTVKGSRRLAVYPQKWFTKDDFDLGYQWITRVARDPVSGRLAGDGIRVTTFVTTADGCRVDYWIDQDPRLPKGHRPMADSF